MASLFGSVTKNNARKDKQFHWGVTGANRTCPVVDSRRFAVMGILQCSWCESLPPVLYSCELVDRRNRHLNSWDECWSVVFDFCYATETNVEQEWRPRSGQSRWLANECCVTVIYQFLGKIRINECRESAKSTRKRRQAQGNIAGSRTTHRTVMQF